MYYTYDNCESIEVPAPFGRTITPMFMGMTNRSPKAISPST